MTRLANRFTSADWRLEMAGVPLDERPAGIVELGLAGRPVSGNRLELAGSRPVPRQAFRSGPTCAHGKGPGMPSAVERAAHAVGQPALFAQLSLSRDANWPPRIWLTTSEVVERRARTRDPDVAGAHNRLLRPGAVEHEQPRPGRRESARAAQATRYPVPSTLPAAAPARRQLSGSTSPATMIVAALGTRYRA